MYQIICKQNIISFSLIPCQESNFLTPNFLSIKQSHNLTNDQSLSVLPVNHKVPITSHNRLIYC